jgi:hypothetical protein
MKPNLSYNMYTVLTFGLFVYTPLLSTFRTPYSPYFSKYIFITSSLHDYSYLLDLRPFTICHMSINFISDRRNIFLQLLFDIKNIWFGFRWQVLITLTRGQTVCMQMPTDWSRTMFTMVVFTFWPFVLCERVNFMLFLFKFEVDIFQYTFLTCYPNVMPIPPLFYIWNT